MCCTNILSSIRTTSRKTGSTNFLNWKNQVWFQVGLFKGFTDLSIAKRDSKSTHSDQNQSVPGTTRGLRLSPHPLLVFENLVTDGSSTPSYL